MCTFFPGCFDTKQEGLAETEISDRHQQHLNPVELRASVHCHGKLIVQSTRAGGSYALVIILGGRRKTALGLCPQGACLGVNPPLQGKLLVSVLPGECTSSSTFVLASVPEAQGHVGGGDGGTGADQTQAS